MEFYDVHFSYIDNETMSEGFISVPEQGSGSLIPDAAMKAEQIYTIGVGDLGMIGVYKIETEVVNGTGKFEKTGLASCRDTLILEQDMILPWHIMVLLTWKLLCNYILSGNKIYLYNWRFQ